MAQPNTNTRAKRPRSHAGLLSLAAYAFGIISIGFGVNAILRPSHSLTFFEIYESELSNVLTAITVAYGIRDVFMGLAIMIPALFGHRKAAGWILMAASGVAVVDGVVCKLYVGSGEWNHWGYAPMIAGVGALLAGALD